MGDGIQVVGQKYLGGGDYLEARLGVLEFRNIGLDLSVLYTWNTFNWDWTPGNWFLDFGLGGNLNARRSMMFLGVQGMAKFGYTFQNSPLSLSLDFAPALGPNIAMSKDVKGGFGWSYNNFGFSVVYKF